MAKDKIVTTFGFVLGFIFGLGLVTFILNLINAAFIKLPLLLGSIVGLIILIGIMAFLILKIHPISSLVAGIIIGALFNVVLKHIGIDKITEFIRHLGI